MADAQIVDCPGCGKRYSVPPGVPPGQFQCQDCSAVVVYGRGAAASAPAKPHGGRGAKAHARAAAAKRRLQRDRASRDEDEGEERPRHAGFHPAGERKKDVTPYILGFATVAILGGFAFFLLSKSKVERAPAERPKEEARAPRPGSGSALDPPPAEKPAPPPPAEAAPPPPPPAEEGSGGGLKVATAKPSGIGGTDSPSQTVANPPTGGLYGKSQAALLVMLQEDRSSVVVPLGHLPDTPPEQQAEIVRLVAAIANPDAGSEALVAQDKLVRIGRAAIPRVLSIGAGLDFSKYANVTDARPACVVAASLGHVMHGITGYEKIRALQYNLTAKIADFPDAIADWYLWWYSTGYKRATFYKKEVEEGGDEKL